MENLAGTMAIADVYTLDGDDLCAACTEKLVDDDPSLKELLIVSQFENIDTTYALYCSGCGAVIHGGSRTYIVSHRPLTVLELSYLAENSTYTLPTGEMVQFYYDDERKNIPFSLFVYHLEQDGDDYRYELVKEEK